MATVPEKPKLPEFPEIDNSTPNTKKVDILIEYIDKVGKYLEEVKVYITPIKQDGEGVVAQVEEDKDGEEERRRRRFDQAGEVGKDKEVDVEERRVRIPVGDFDEEEKGADAITPTGGGKKKQRKTKKKGGADIDYSKVYNVQGLIENISKSTGKDPIASQSVPAPFSTGSPLQRFGKKEAKSLPNELKNEIIPDYSQDGGKKKKTEKKKMPKKK